jgi:hypothetical protein
MYLKPENKIPNPKRQIIGYFLYSDNQFHIFSFAADHRQRTTGTAFTIAMAAALSKDTDRF